MSSDTFALRESSLSIADGIAHFVHRRPEARNALSLELRADYAEMVDRIQADRDVRALIISGSGGSFCAGGDLKSLKARQASGDPELNSPDAMRLRIQKLHGWLARLRDLEIPVIAAVDGPAYGAGFAIALLADFVLASERASFCMSFAKIGLVPDSAAFYSLPRLVGLQKAKELLFTARRVEAAEALELGLVHSLYKADELEMRARDFALRLREAPREAIGMSKRLLNRSFETPYDTLAELESLAQAVASTCAYHSQAVDGFLAGQPARFDWDRPADA